MSQSVEINKLAEALTKAQANMHGAVKDSKNPFFQSKYADLESVWTACRDVLTKNGLSVTQTTDVTDKGTVLITTLIHSSGQWISGNYPILAVKQDPQSLGAAVTYARRYALAAMVGVVQTDDDGEAAMGRGGVYADEPGPNDGIKGEKVKATPKPKVIVAPAEKKKRDLLNERALSMYRPFKQKFPNVVFRDLLFQKYGVIEVNLMSLEQYENFVNYMASELARQEESVK